MVWVAPKSNARGQAGVWLEGLKLSTVDLYSTTTQEARPMVFTEAVDPTRSHTLAVQLPDTRMRLPAATWVAVNTFVRLR
jgi:hypothetical protein